MSNYKASLIERETIIIFNEQEPEAEIYTHNVKLINRLKRYPIVAKIKRKDETGAYTFVLPKKQLSIVIKNPISDEHRQIMSEIGKKQVRQGVIPHRKEK